MNRTIAADATRDIWNGVNARRPFGFEAISGVTAIDLNQLPPE